MSATKDMTEINVQDLHDLLEYFSKNTYRAKDPDNTSQKIMQRCILLANIDYAHLVISNYNGELSAHYPSHLIILEYEKRNQNICDTPPPAQRTTETIYESIYDAQKLKDMMKNARVARCRSRFPLPVILYKGRHVCRSATLSGGPEIYGRSGFEYFFAGNETTAALEEEVEDSEEQTNKQPDQSDWQLFDKVRNQDIKLLKTLNVGTIIDFMVEKKKVKFGVNVTSSEKVDKERRYSDFTIISLPYPGCEFFKEFRENDYLAMGLVFDWSQTHVDAEIGVPEDPISSQLRINWEQYQVWDLVNLTQNYLKLILRYLNDSSSGLLIHCISGWDRTPLFISLLRISLWADGVIHTNLSANQMLFFTIAYDWMLFGHDLQDRLAKGEEIFYFCFYFIKHIYEDEFSVNKRHGSVKHAVLRNDSDSQLDNVMFDTEPGVQLSSVSSNLSLNSCCSNISQNSRDSQDNNPPSVFHCSPADSQEDAQGNGYFFLLNESSSPDSEKNNLDKENSNVVPCSLHSSAQKENSSSQGSRSPLPTNRTSPVAVPIPGRVRQRNESSSSGGSWQMISCTGSLRGSTTANAPTLTDGLASSSYVSTNSVPGQNSQESSTTVVDEDLYCFLPYRLSRKCSNRSPSKRQKRLENLRQVFYTVYNQTVGLKMKDNSETTGIGQLLGNFAEKVGIISVQRTSL